MMMMMKREQIWRSALHFLHLLVAHRCSHVFVCRNRCLSWKYTVYKHTFSSWQMWTKESFVLGFPILKHLFFKKTTKDFSHLSTTSVTFGKNIPQSCFFINIADFFYINCHRKETRFFFILLGITEFLTFGFFT